MTESTVIRNTSSWNRAGFTMNASKKNEYTVTDQKGKAVMVDIQFQDYYALSSTRPLIKLVVNDMSRMSEKEAARLLKDIIDKAPGVVALENFAQALSNIYRFMEEPCDKDLGLSSNIADRLGKVFLQLKRTAPAAYDKLMRTYTAQLNMKEKINSSVSEIQFQELEASRMPLGLR